MQSNEMSHNGHETKAELASRNLLITIQSLTEMRWMIVDALGAGTPGVVDFDKGISKLLDAQHRIDAVKIRQQSDEVQQ